MTYKTWLLAFWLFGLQVAPLCAAVTLATPFCDGVVLQRGKPVAVWGTAVPAERIKVEFKGQTKVTTADSSGKWRVQLNALQASAEPATLTVTGKNTVTVTDVRVGEVWLCSGQSNMNLPLSSAREADREIAAANHPLIRYFEVESVVSEQPLEMAEGAWKVCTSATAGRFTAVGYFFARELQRELGVSVGIIKATLGGSPIEGWMSAGALDECGVAARAAHEEWKPLAADYQQRTADHQTQVAGWKAREAQARASGQSFTEPRPLKAQKESDRKKPGGLYIGFIHPLEPLTLAGFLWYQGEGNADAPADYRVLFPAMIRQWRRDFQQEDLPFLFVQLPNFGLPKDSTKQQWAWFREVQTSVLSLSNMHMAVTIDVGDPGDIHPANKQEVGRRLALLALRRVYDRHVEDTGPGYAGLERQGDALRIRFTAAAGLHFKGATTNAFVIAGSDRRFVPAEARIEGQTVRVSAKQIPEPVAFRYNWENDPQGWLFNAHGLPAAPFRSDDW